MHVLFVAQRYVGMCYRPTYVNNVGTTIAQRQVASFYVSGARDLNKAGAGIGDKMHVLIAAIAVPTTLKHILFGIAPSLLTEGFFVNSAKVSPAFPSSCLSLGTFSSRMWFVQQHLLDE